MVVCNNCQSENANEAAACVSCGNALPVHAQTVGGAPHVPRVDPILINFLAGRYLAAEVIGEGSTKRVYRARDTVLGREVALAHIKVGRLDDRHRQRILREAQLLAELGTHPNIMEIYDFGEEDGQVCLVLPLMAGGSLENLIEAGEAQPLRVEVVLQIATDVCQGLEFAHSNGIVHRDVKPGNIWLTEDGIAQIGDFGLAFSTAYTRLTESGMMVGTFSYIAPELAMGGEVGALSDLYSFGVVLYEMIAGHPPFEAENVVALIGRHINSQPIPTCEQNPNCPKRLEDLILRLLAKEPADRPQSATQVLEELEHAGRTMGAATSALDDVPSKELRVLIVEDSEADALLIAHELGRPGYVPTTQRVDTPAAMRDALEIGTWDLVISDHSLPEFSAPAALKLLQNSGLDLPFIIVSGEITAEIAVEAMKSGAHDFVLKDDLDRLVPAVERELREADIRRQGRVAESEQRRLRRDLEEQRLSHEQEIGEISRENQRLRERLDRAFRRGGPDSQIN